MNLESESETLYRAEYLAGEVLAAADAGRYGFSLERLQALLAQPDEPGARSAISPRRARKEGYEKGIHDHDAAAILVRLLPLRESAGLCVSAFGAGLRQPVLEPPARGAGGRRLARAGTQQPRHPADVRS